MNDTLGAKLYELRAPSLEPRFFGGAAKKDKRQRRSGDNPNDSAEEDLMEMGEGRNDEESFLTSANLCRYASLLAFRDVSFYQTDGELIVLFFFFSHARWIIDYKEIQMGKQVRLRYNREVPLPLFYLTSGLHRTDRHRQLWAGLQGQVEGHRCGGETLHQAEAHRKASPGVPRRDGLPFGTEPPQRGRLYR